MYFRVKKTDGRSYLQLVESVWDGDRSRQRVIASLGRLDDADGRARVEALMQSLARLSQDDQPESK